MTHVTVNACNHFGAKTTPLAHLFKTSVLAAMAARVMGGDTAMSQWNVGANIAFYPNETLWKLVCPELTRVPRIIVSINPRDARMNTPANCCVEIEIPPRSKPGPLTVTVLFPDQVFGLEYLVSRMDKSRYRGLYFNSTPGEHLGNLFEVLNSVADIVATKLAEHCKGVQDAFKNGPTMLTKPVAGLVWTQMPANDLNPETWCADGDGMVTVLCVGQRHMLFHEITFVRQLSDNLQLALEQASDWMKHNEPAMLTHLGGQG